MRIAPEESNVLPSREDNSVTPAVIKSPNSVKKNHRRKAKPEREKVKPRKARLPNGNYFQKVFREKHWKVLLHKRKGQGKIRKLRGAMQKEAARLYKIKYPKGKKMACKDGPDHRQTIEPRDIRNLMHLDLRPAQRYLTRLRKKMGKARGEIITLREFCENTPFKEKDVIPYLKK